MSKAFTLRKAALVATLAGSLVLLSACNNDSDKGANATIAPATTVAGAMDATQPASDSDATELVTTAIAALGPDYHFATTVKVGDAVVLAAQGDRVGTGARLSLSSDAGVVNYLIVGADSWAKPENGVWAQLEAAPSNTDPMVALAQASAAKVVSVEGGTTTVELTVTNADLGIGAEGTATVTVQITDGRLVFAVYGTTLENQPALVSTEFGAVVDATPVTAPTETGA